MGWRSSRSAERIRCIRGCPIFVLTGKALTDEESEILDELASAVILKETAVERLGDFLGSIFTFTEIEGCEE